MLKPIDIEFRASGIANAKATVVVQDNNDGIWIATSGGGVSYFQPDKDYWQTVTQVDGLANPDIRSMIVTQSGDIWFGTATGASRYCAKSHQWQTLLEQQGLPNNSVWSLLQDQHQNIWFGTNGGGIAVMDNRGQIQQFHNTANGLAGNVVNGLCEDNKGNIWAGTKTGLGCYNPQTKTWVSYTTTAGLVNNAINDVTSDDDGNIWIATNNGVSQFSPDTNQWQSYTTVDGLGSDTTQTISFKTGGGLWVGTRNGISHFDPKTNVFTTLTQKDGLTDNMVWGIFQDNHNNLWIPTWGGGVSLYNTVKNSWQTYTTPSEFADTYTLGIINSAHQHVWIGTWGAISHYNMKNGEWLTLSSAEDLPNNNINCLAELTEGEVWAGAWGGLMSYTIATKQWCYLTEKDGLTNSGVISLLGTNKNTLLVGTQSGLSELNTDTKAWTPINSAQLSQREIQALHIDCNGNLWVGTDDGLYEQNKHEQNKYQQNKVQQNSQDSWYKYDVSSGLLSNQIQSITSSSDGVIWIATSAGLNRYAPAKNNAPTKNNWQSFDNETYFNGQSIQSLVADKENVWVACTGGLLIQISLSSCNFASLKAFGSDILTSLAIDSDQNLWIASQGGGAFWMKRHGKESGYLQNFTAGAQTFANQMEVSGDKVLLGRPGAISVSGMGSNTEQNSEKTPEQTVFPVLHNPLVAKIEGCSDKIWVASDETGLYQSELSDQEKVIHLSDKQHIANLNTRHVTCLTNESATVIWVGTSGGISWTTEDSTTATNISSPNIPVGPVNAICRIDENSVCVAYNTIPEIQFGNGVDANTRSATSLFKVTASETAALEITGADASSFKSAQVLSMVSGPDSVLWIGTNMGIFYYSLKTNIIARQASIPSDGAVTKVVCSNGGIIYALATIDQTTKCYQFNKDGTSRVFEPDTLGDISAMALNDDDQLVLSLGSRLYLE